MRSKIKQIKGQRDQRSNRSTFAKIKDQKDQRLKDQRSKRSRDQRSTKFKGERSKVKDQKKLTSGQEVNFWKVQRSKDQRSNQLFELSSRKTGDAQRYVRHGVGKLKLHTFSSCKNLWNKNSSRRTPRPNETYCKIWNLRKIHKNWCTEVNSTYELRHF